MTTLALIGLLGGLITGVSPCVLPMLPIIFFAGGAATTDADAPAAGRDRRPLKIIAGVVVSFSLIALLGSSAISLLGLPDQTLRWISLVVLTLVGLGMLFPALGHLIEKPFYRLPKVSNGNASPFVLGLGLGTLYVPCAGPVLAAITVAGATGQIGAKTVVLTLSFAIGAAIPLLVFATAGANIRKRINAYRARERRFRILGGVLLIALAIGMVFNLPQVLQRAVPSYTSGLEEKIADSDAFQGAITPIETDENKLLSRCVPGDSKLAECGPAPALRGTGEWFNTDNGEALTLDSLKGQVVLIDFFAYSCINCQRDQPYIEKWYDAYRDAGFTVIGVHAPEFAFEKSASNLKASLEREGTTYPVVQDNDLKTWTAYRNQYWPAKYLIDRDGTVRAIKFGEGSYDTTESLIRQLLTEDDPAVTLPDPVTDIDPQIGVPDRTPELYLAAGRSTGYYGSPRFVSTSVRDYTLRDEQPLNTWSFGGAWRVGTEMSTATNSSQLKLHYRGQNVYAVMDGIGTVTVSQAGKPDIVIQVDGAKLYPVIEGDDTSQATLTFSYTAGVEVFTFTFG